MPNKKREPGPYRNERRGGVYYAWVSRDDRDHSLDTKDPVIAQERFLDYLKSRGVSGGEPAAPSIGLGRLIEDTINESRKTAGSKRTWKEARYDLIRFARFLQVKGVTRAQQFTRNLLVDYIAFRQPTKEDASGIVNLVNAKARKSVTNGRVNRELVNINKLIKRAVAEKQCPASLLTDMTDMKLREAKHLPSFDEAIPTMQELDRFLARVRDDRYRILFTAARGTGMRHEELLHFDESDIGKGELRLQPKGAGSCACCPDGYKLKSFAARSVPISKTTEEALRALLALRRATPPLHDRSENRAARVKLGTRLLREREAAGLTIAQVAKPLGVSVQTIYAYENGRKAPPGERCTALEKLLKLKYGALPRLSIGDVTFNLDSGRLNEIIAETCAAAGIDKKFTMHGFRRCWATHMYNTGLALKAKTKGKDGWDLKQVSKWLGHADVATTERYLRLESHALPRPDLLPF